MSNWRTIKNHDGTGFEPIEFVEIGAVHELEKKYEREHQIALKFAMERDQLRAENEQWKTEAYVRKAAYEEIFAQNQRLTNWVNEINEKGYKWQQEAERLRAALELIQSKNMDPSGPAYGAIKIAREALSASTKKDDHEK